MCALLTKCEVKILAKKKQQGQYPAIFGKQAWSIKDSLYNQKKPLQICFNL